MVFEFSGEKPPLLNTSNAFKSFAPTANASSASTPNASSLGSPLVPAASGITSPFGCAASSTPPPQPTGRITPFRNVSFGNLTFGSPTGLHHASFGSGSPFTFGTSSSLSQSTSAADPIGVPVGKQETSSSRATLKSTIPPTQPHFPDTSITRALKRFADKRPAIFGRADIAADQVVQDMLRAGEVNVPALLGDIRSLEASKPELADFLNTIFARLVNLKAPLPLQTAPQADTHNGEESGNGDGEDAMPDNNGFSLGGFWQWRFKVPRGHWRVKGLEEHLADVLIDEDFIHYPEGAKVLSGYILDKLFAGNPPTTVEREIDDALGRDHSGVGVQVLDLIKWILKKVCTVDDFYRFEPGYLMRGSMDPDESKAVVKPQEEACSATSSSTNQHFRFLDLPAELRNWVYIEQLAPEGNIKLIHREHAKRRKGDHHHPRFAVESSCEIDILLVCHQIYDEAKSVLYRENTLCVPGDVCLNLTPFICPRLLPKAALPLLASVTLVCDMSHDDAKHGPRDASWFTRVNWRQLQAMTTLKQLRICVVEGEEQRDNQDFQKQLMLEQIIERVPADCEVSYESKHDFEIDYVQEVVEEMEASRKYRHRGLPDVYEVEEPLLNKLAEKVKHVQGRKSGDERDYRFPPKPVAKTLQELIAAGEVDPSIVLGGSQ